MTEATRAARAALITAFIILATTVFLFVVLRPEPAKAQLGGNAGFTFTHISTATNTQIKSAQGQLHNIVINGGTLTGAITVVDTSAANCTGGQTIGVIAANQVAGQNYSYDLQTLNGICITTAAAVDATVDWR